VQRNSDRVLGSYRFHAAEERMLYFLIAQLKKEVACQEKEIPSYKPGFHPRT
jgi:hypothetical protein